MNDDRALLEAAAKAAGYEFRPTYNGYMLVGVKPYWNPLTDNGDALMLAVKMNMNVFQSARSAYAIPSDDDGTYEQQVRYSDAGGDPYAATRRAIVRAAAVMVPEETP